MKKHSRVQTLIFAAVLLAAGTAFAQERQMRDTDTLKLKIEQMEQIDLSNKAQSAQSLYKCTLYRLYSEYSQALKQEMADLKNMQAALKGTGSDPKNDLGARVQGLSSELSITTEKMRTVEADLRGSCAPTSSTTSAPAAVAEQPRSQIVDTSYRQSNVTRERTISDNRVSLDAVPTSDTVSRNSPPDDSTQVDIKAPTLDTPISQPTPDKKTKIIPDWEITGKGAIPGAEVKLFVASPSKGNQKTPIDTTIADADGNFTFLFAMTPQDSNVKEMAVGRRLYVQQTVGGIDSRYSAAARVTKPEEAQAEKVAEEDLEPKGPVGLMFGGSVISNQGQRFSQADPFFGFVAGYTSRPLSNGRNGRVNLRFEGLFTAQPRTATAPAEQPTTAPPPGSGLNQDLPFLSSRKSFDVNIQLWWERPIMDSRYLSIGPYASIGASTALDNNELLGEDVRVDAKDAGQATTATGGSEIKLDASQAQSDNDLKMYWEFGPLLSVRIPERGLFLQSMLTYGRYEALRGLYVDSTGVERYDTRKRFRGQLRIFPLGLARGFGKQTKMTPMFGVDLNASRGPDSLRFFSGFIVNLAALTKAKDEDKETK
jgi:hypothetical protein